MVLEVSLLPPLLVLPALPVFAKRLTKLFKSPSASIPDANESGHGRQEVATHRGSACVCSPQQSRGPLGELAFHRAVETTHDQAQHKSTEMFLPAAIR